MTGAEGHGPKRAFAAAAQAGETSEMSCKMRRQPALRFRRSCWLVAMVCLAVSVLAVSGVGAAEEPDRAEASDGDASVSADSVEVVRGVAPEWPFQGFFAPALGRFWDTGRGRMHDVSDGIEFGACYELYVDVDAESIRMGYMSYLNPATKHYVIPWGDAAYPVLHSDIARTQSSSAEAQESNLGRANTRMTAERISATTQESSWYSDETEITYSQIDTFQLHNALESRSYLPLVSRWPPVGAFVEIDSKGSATDDLDTMDKLLEEFGGRAYIQHLGISGSDGRFYGLSLYNVGHPMCSDTELSFVVDGITGQVVACYDYMMEAQTSLVFVASEDSFVSDDFALPNAMWPVEADNCGVRLDGDHPDEFFRRAAALGPSEFDERDDSK